MTVRDVIAMLDGMDPPTRSRRHGSSAKADVAGMGGGWPRRGLGRMERLGVVAAGRRLGAGMRRMEPGGLISERGASVGVNM